MNSEIKALSQQHDVAIANGQINAARRLARIIADLERRDVEEAPRRAELAEIKSCVEGSLSWLDGYTDPFPDGYQRRVTQLHPDREGTTLWRFEPTDSLGETRVVRVTVQVEEVVLSDPAERIRS